MHNTAVLKYPRSILSSISFELKQLDHDILCAVPDVQLLFFQTVSNDTCRNGILPVE